MSEVLKCKFVFLLYSDRVDLLPVRSKTIMGGLEDLLGVY